MLMTLTPISVFQAVHKELATEHQASVRSNAILVKLSFALAAMSGKSNVTNENLIGARIFIDTFLNMAEKPEPVKPVLPNKDLGFRQSDKKDEKK
jgi:hypothetical protein